MFKAGGSLYLYPDADLQKLVHVLQCMMTEHPQDHHQQGQEHLENLTSLPCSTHLNMRLLMDQKQQGMVLQPCS